MNAPELPKKAKDVLFDLSMVESSANTIREEIENLTGQARNWLAIGPSSTG